MLDYLASNDITKVRFHALDMIMNIHSNASHLLAPRVRRQTCGHFFIGWIPNDNKPTKLNSTFHTSTTVIRFVVASAAEAKLGVSFYNCQTAIIF